ncbi:MAG: non-ribosomal peptide synthetase [Candidatus Eremiobacteraeota bacterium]|nr:non-ribosomal peptide synthetase [Candidatus Eremiobacteraeota bacterium]
MIESAYRPVARTSVAQRFAARAAAAPYRVAAEDSRGSLTYEQLERESNALARRLRELGAGPDRCVGICVERSTRFIVAALAVLKSGSAYVPLDSSTPAQRVAEILSDAAVVAFVTEPAIAQGLPAPSWPVISLGDAAFDESKDFTPAENDPDSLAYVVYTSGSTGNPKGVEITHANLNNLVDWHQSAFAVTEADRASLVASFGFDAAAWEIWPYLTAGASVSVADESTRRSAETLRGWLVAQRITIAFVPTALAEELFVAAWPPETCLRVLLTGGDTLQRRPPAGLPFAVVNNYGPTECTVVATSRTVVPGESTWPRPSIGRPIANARAWIVDESLQEVAAGEAGELCVAGALVARGYRNLPELTASQFITLTDEAGQAVRAYRTGDRARLRSDGQIEFLGRVDDQVKVRGFRIEPGEIVACLLQHPSVGAAAVAVRELCTGPVLVGYVVAAGSAHPTEADLRTHLAARLPEYMLPAAFVAMRALPVGANGKVDKSALPAPSPENSLPRAAATNGALTGVERQVARLVADLMSRPSIDADDNFFMFGGHSMLGVQLVARIRETFGVQLPLRQLFTAPTVRELSSEVSRLMTAG